jgi:site-specific recombinase XerD
MTTKRAFEKIDLIQLQKDFLLQLSGKGRSLNTIKNYKTDLDCFNTYLSNTKKGLDITDFQLPQVKEYGDYLESKYKSDNSRRRRVQALRIFFDYLVETQVFEGNPVRKLPTSPKFLDIPRPTPFIDVKTLWVHLLNEAEQPSQLAALTAKRNQLVMLFIYGAGLRVSDLAKLKHDQISAATPYRVLVKHEKRDPYTIPLPDIFGRVYEDYLKLLEVCKKDSDIEFNELLFNANPYRILSGGLSPRGLEVVFEELRKKLQIILTPKSLRQACIFKWLAQKNTDGIIKEWLGMAPSYSLKLYKDHLENHIYTDNFLEELYKNQFAKS